MRLRVFVQCTPQTQQRLYDLVREVLEVHRGFPRPVVVITNGGSLPCDRITLPGRSTSPVVPSPYNFRSHPATGRPLTA